MSLITSLFERRAPRQTAPVDASLAAFVHGCSIEVMPRTAAKIESFAAILPEGTRVYIAHIEGTPVEEMVETAARIRGEGFAVMPHFPARIIMGRADLEDRIRRYADVGVDQALLLAGGVDTPHGDYATSMQLMESGLFDAHGFTRLHVAGHPEGNRDIDPDGSDRHVMEALRWKQAFSERTDAAMAITTQFCFEAGPVIAWAERLQREGIALPVHIGVAGPAKLQTLLKFAVSCGVGPSLRVLQRRAADATKLLLPFEPDAFLTELAHHRAANPGFGIEAVHLFPLGGIGKTAEWINRTRAAVKAA